MVYKLDVVAPQVLVQWQLEQLVVLAVLCYTGQILQKDGYGYVSGSLHDIQKLLLPLFLLQKEPKERRQVRFDVLD